MDTVDVCGISTGTASTSTEPLMSSPMHSDRGRLPGRPKNPPLPLPPSPRATNPPLRCEFSTVGGSSRTFDGKEERAFIAWRCVLPLQQTQDPGPHLNNHHGRHSTQFPDGRDGHMRRAVGDNEAGIFNVTLDLGTQRSFIHRGTLERLGYIARPLSLAIGGISTAVIVHVGPSAASCSASPDGHVLTDVFFLRLLRHLDLPISGNACPQLPAYVFALSTYLTLGILHVIRRPKYLPESGVLVILSSVLVSVVYGFDNMIDAFFISGYLSLVMTMAFELLEYLYRGRPAPGNSPDNETPPNLEEVASEKYVLLGTEAKY